MYRFSIIHVLLPWLLRCRWDFASCSSDDDEPKNDQTLPYVNSWGEVLRGDNMELQFYPDHFAYYGSIPTAPRAVRILVLRSKESSPIPAS